MEQPATRDEPAASPKMTAPSERKRRVRVMDVVMAATSRSNCLASRGIVRETEKKLTANHVKQKHQRGRINESADVVCWNPSWFALHPLTPIYSCVRYRN